LRSSSDSFWPKLVHLNDHIGGKAKQLEEDFQQGQFLSIT